MKRIVCFVLSACAFMFLQLFVFAENINIDYAVESSLEYGADVQEPIEIHTSNVLEGEGTEESPYIISNLADFLFFGEKVNSGDPDYFSACYLQTDHIKVLDAGLVPIGTLEYPFCGVYDGNGYSISYTLTAETSTANYGLFSVAKNASFKNLSVFADVYSVYSDSEEAAAALLCARYLSDKSAEFAISNCYAKGNLRLVSDSTVSFAGGLVGRINIDSGKLVISDCASDVSVFSQAKNIGYAAGIAGCVSVSSKGVAQILQCFSTNKVEAHGNSVYAYAGGITGYFMQDPKGWTDWYTLSSAESTQLSVSCCISDCELVSQGKSKGYIGGISAYIHDEMKYDKLYFTGVQITPTSMSVNGEIKNKGEVFENAFLTTDLNFDLLNTWTLVPGERLFISNNCPELFSYVNQETGEISVCPVNCEAGKLIVSFYSADGRYLRSKVFDFNGTNGSVFSAAAASGTKYVKTYLLDAVTVKPLSENSTLTVG